MAETELSRRLFLQHGATLAGAGWAATVLPALAALSRDAAAANDADTAFRVLGAAEAAEFEAIAARILPTTDTPGAREAGVIHFIDQAFATFNEGMLGPARGMLAQFQAGVPGAAAFSSLSEADQDAYLEASAETPFFGLMRFLTLAGFFGMEKYGGNRGQVGWKLLGVDPNTHVYVSPFGYYDAEYLREKGDG